MGDWLTRLKNAIIGGAFAENGATGAVMASSGWAQDKDGNWVLNPEAFDLNTRYGQQMGLMRSGLGALGAGVTTAAAAPVVAPLVAPGTTGGNMVALGGMDYLGNKVYQNLTGSEHTYMGDAGLTLADMAGVTNPYARNFIEIGSEFANPLMWMAGNPLVIAKVAGATDAAGNAVKSAATKAVDKAIVKPAQAVATAADHNAWRAADAVLPQSAKKWITAQALSNEVAAHDGRTVGNWYFNSPIKRWTGEIVEPRFTNNKAYRVGGNAEAQSMAETGMATHVQGASESGRWRLRHFDKDFNEAANMFIDPEVTQLSRANILNRNIRLGYVPDADDLKALLAAGQEVILSRKPLLIRKPGSAHGDVLQASMGNIWGGNFAGGRSLRRGVLEIEPFPARYSTGGRSYFSNTTFAESPSHYPMGSRVGFLPGEINVGTTRYFEDAGGLIDNNLPTGYRSGGYINKGYIIPERRINLTEPPASVDGGLSVFKNGINYLDTYAPVYGTRPEHAEGVLPGFLFTPNDAYELRNNNGIVTLIDRHLPVWTKDTRTLRRYPIGDGRYYTYYE